MSVSSIRAARAAATTLRLLDAVAEILRAEGPAAVSVQRVATVAGTSKGLVHYHFADKDALLVACAERLCAQLVDAEESSLRSTTADTALDDLWSSIVEPRIAGARGALLALAAGPSAATRDALASAATRRRSAACTTIERLAGLIGIAPGIPHTTLALTYLAFADGLALDHALHPSTLHRQAFDAFWLAVLSLG
ncbi:MAG TPA: TetR/AcrR family transcriptional regulator [Gemmatimonadaceae bacterium]|nr:TetR/AcrR family transcriptional regulator [Gemmatimonadaceae bacterium]